MPQKKMGCPLSENPLTERLYLRVDEKTNTLLDKCTETLVLLENPRKIC